MPLSPGIRKAPPMITTADWNNITTYLGGLDSNSQINTSRILLNTGYPSYALNSWESSTAGKIKGAMIDAVAAAILTGQVLGYKDAQPSDPTGTASTTGVMMGLGSTASYAPARSGVVVVIVQGQMSNATGSDGAKVGLRYGTGTAPSNGAALTGTAKGQGSQVDSYPNAGCRFPFFIYTVITGLTVGTTYWFDLGLGAITGGTANVKNAEIVIINC